MILKIKERELLERVKAEGYISFGLYKEIKELLAQPEQTEQEPLSDKDVGKGFLLTDVWHRYESFIAGVRWAEQQHGIGGEE